MTATHWTEPAIAAALNGRFYGINGRCRHEEREKAEREAERKTKAKVDAIRSMRSEQAKAQQAVAQKVAVSTRGAILIAVAWAHGLEVEDIRKQSRRNAIVRARQHACALMRELTTRSLRQIAEAVGLMDHATVIHSIRTWAKHRDRYAEQDRAARQMLGVG